MALTAKDRKEIAEIAAQAAIAAVSAVQPTVGVQVEADEKATPKKKNTRRSRSNKDKNEPNRFPSRVADAQGWTDVAVGDLVTYNGKRRGKSQWLICRIDTNGDVFADKVGKA